MPWKTGTCDNLLGTDGYPIAGKPKQRQPYRIQGIEVLCGAYEPLCDVIVNQVKTSADEGHCELYKCFDSRKYSSALDANHVKLDLELPARDSKTNGKWMYNEDWQESAKCPGLLVPTGSKGTSTTGTCDAIYSDPISSPGLRELRCFGHLRDGSMCGAFCGGSNIGLGNYWWNCGGRLSGLGVTMA